MTSTHLSATRRTASDHHQARRPQPSAQSSGRAYVRRELDRLLRLHGDPQSPREIDDGAVAGFPARIVSKKGSEVTVALRLESPRMREALGESAQSGEREVVYDLKDGDLIF